ncbi:hypothetical protein K2Y11_08380 [bacterium]|jgi:hypothetical protein|nr:hypothetical protein [bacterium]
MLPDLDKFRVPFTGIPSHSDVTDPPPSIPRHATGEKFLRGPIPWGWLMRAMNLLGIELSLALIIWRLVYVYNSPIVQLVPSEYEFLRKDRKTIYRALRELERAELIKVARKRGRSPIVTLVSPTKAVL